MNRDELIERTRTGWAVLNDRAAHVPEDRMTSAPGNAWSGKDQLAHVAMWHRVGLARILGTDEDALVGWTKEESASKSIDEVNARIREVSRERPIGDIRKDFEDSHAEIVAAIEGMTEEDLGRPWLPGHPERGTFAQMIGSNTFEHYEEHIPLLEALAEE